MSASSLFGALNLVWGGDELLLSRRRRASDGGAHDQGSLKHLWRVLSEAVAVAVVLAYSGLAHWPQGWDASLQWAGCALIGSGLALRVWAIQVLARVHGGCDHPTRSPADAQRPVSLAAASFVHRRAAGFSRAGAGHGQCVVGDGDRDAGDLGLPASHPHRRGRVATCVPGGLPGVCGAEPALAAVGVVTPATRWR